MHNQFMDHDFSSGIIPIEPHSRHPKSLGILHLYVYCYLDIQIYFNISLYFNPYFTSSNGSDILFLNARL